MTHTIRVALVLAALSVAPSAAVAGAYEACDAGSGPAKLNFTLKDVDGAKVKLTDLKGKVIALNFWATWCVPCKAEIPEFVELQSRYGDRGLQFVGLSVDDPLGKLKPYVAEMKINYPVLQGRGHDEVLDAFSPINSLPVTILIRRDGTVCRKHVGPVAADVLEREIESLIVHP
jgi:thiol-disulfide isomerase/thioredoxin